jgi:bifunctional DNA-binding transcriptional regulator/antitoxin component of YhaV-PrlF toxin-antitoxin module
MVGGIRAKNHPAMKPQRIRFDAKGRVIIPRRLCKEFQIEPGTRATIRATPDGILLTPITPAFISSLRGKYKHLQIMEAFMEDRKRKREL